jgi:curli production assembly/transport component CsgG
LEQPQDTAQVQLPPLRPANLIVTGAIVAYESNVRTGGIGVRYLGVGPSDLYRQDQVTINLRAVDIRSGEVIQSVTTTKTVFSIQLDFGIFKFVSLKHLLEVETGLSRNEPVQQCVREAIEAGLIHLIAQGARDGSWQLKNPEDLKKPLLQGYLQAYDEVTQSLPISSSEQSTITGDDHAVH